jgi:hypothetical protein
MATKFLLRQKKTSNSIQNSQAGRRRFDPDRALQILRQLSLVLFDDVHGALAKRDDHLLTFIRVQT